MKLKKTETLLVGSWIEKKGKVIADDNCIRIQYLINTCLNKIASSEDGWDVLYRDNDDNRYWELLFPDSYQHGGGPPTLKFINKNDAKDKYNLPEQA